TRSANGTGRARSRASGRSRRRWRREVRSRDGSASADALSSIRDRVVRLPLSSAARISLAAVVVMVFVYYAQFSGSLQWGLGLAFLGLLAVLAWRQVFRGPSEPAPLVRAGDLDGRYAWVRRARERGGFTHEFQDVLARMEAWR